VANEDGAVATFGIAFRQSQINLLATFEKITMLYDSSDDAQRAADNLGNQLNGLGVDVESILIKDYKDPGDIPLEEARQLCEEWKEIELAASDSGEEVPLCFCHGDYQYHNILRQDRGFFLVNFEKCQADGPVRDLYLLLRKLLEKSEWDAEWGRVLLAAYESVRPLKPYERQDLVYRLSYPEKLWKIVNFYYNSGKAWIPEKNVEKLKTLESQREARRRFLSRIK
jgi:CotS family spore coat protein